METKQYLELLSRMELIDKKLNAIYQLLKENNIPTIQDSRSKPSSTSTTSPDGKVYKSSINFEQLLNSIQDDKTRSMVQDIYMNKYPTITPGQFNLLKDIGKKNNFSL